MLNKDSSIANAPCEVNNNDDPQSLARSQHHNNDDEIAPLSPSIFNVTPIDEGDYLPPFFSPLPSIVDSFGEYNMNTSPQYDVELNPPYQYLGWNDMDNIFTTIPLFQPPPPSWIVSPKDETTTFHGDCVGQPNHDHFHRQDSSSNNDEQKSNSELKLEVELGSKLELEPEKASYDPPDHQYSSNPNLSGHNSDEEPKNELESEVESESVLVDRNNNIPLHSLPLVDDDNKESSDKPPFHRYSTLSSPSMLLPLVDYSDDDKDEEDEESRDDDQSSPRENITLSSLFPLVVYSSSDQEDQESSDDDKPSYQNPSTKLDAVSSSSVVEVAPSLAPPSIVMPGSSSSSGANTVVSALPMPSAIVVPSSSSSCASHPPENNNKQAAISVKQSKYYKRKRNQSKEKKVNEGSDDDVNTVVGFRKGVPTVSEMDLLQAFLHFGTNHDTLWPLIIRVNVKQDVVATLKLIAEEKQLNLLILGTVGTFSLVELLHQGNLATFEKNGEKTETTTQLSLSVVGADGKVFGGPVHGRLIASSPMQMIGLTMARKGGDKTRNPREKITIPKLQMLIKSIKDRAKADKAKTRNIPESSKKEEATNCGSDLCDMEVKMVDMNI
ncbi:hypothetical protein HN51_011343 [Arachis hypogaea]